MPRASNRETAKSSRGSSRAPKSDPREEGMEERTGEVAKERGFTGGTNTILLPEGVEYFNPEGETYNLSIVPYEITDDKNLDKIEKGKLWWRKRYLVHRNIGVENQAYVCPKSIGKRCPICEHLAPLYKNRVENKAIIDPIKPKQRDLFNVDLGDRKGIQILEISSFNFTDVLMEEIDVTGDKYRGFSKIIGGYIVITRFSMEKFGGNDYAKATRIDFESRGNLPERTLNKAVNLDKVLNVLSYEELNDIFMEMSDEPTDTEEPDRNEDAGAGSSGGSSKRSKPDEEACPCGHVLGKDKDQHDDCTAEDKCSEEQYGFCEDEKERLEKE